MSYTDLQTNNTNLQSILDMVNALPEAFAPAGTINITANGTYDVKSYASASVNIVASGGGTDMEDGLVTRTLTSYTNDRVTTIGDSAFYDYTKLQSVNFPACTTIRIYAFRNCTSLQSISFPVCKHIGVSVFDCCTSLQSVNFPACTTIEAGAFHYCSSLQSVSFPACTTIRKNAFDNCPSLQSVSFPACTTIDSMAFCYCPSLSQIYLEASTVCTLANSNAFSNTGIRSNKGYIYVPLSLKASYKSATNWTYFSNIIYGYC